MEHLLFLLIEFVLWVDRRCLKPLDRVVPNLNELRERPAVTLNEGDIVIGPYRRWGTGTALGLLVGFVVVMGVLVLLITLVDRPARPGRQAFLFGFGLLVLVVLGLSVVLMLRLLQGGRVVLRSGGVEFQYHGTTVTCPWALFNAEGSPFLPTKDRLLIPVQPPAVPLVEARRHDLLLAQGKLVRTRPMKFKHANLAELRAVYEVEIVEVGKLLQYLGQQLGQTLPARSRFEEDEEGPVLASSLARRTDGWIKASLVHLTFPPYCCGCGTATSVLKEYKGQATGLLDGGASVPLLVPVCLSCQRTHRRALMRSVFTGIVVGLLGAFVLALVLCVALRIRRRMGLSLVLSALGGVVGGVVGAAAGTLQTNPLRLRDYSPSEGTIQLWFRNPDYADALMELFAGVEEKPEETETGTPEAVIVEP